MEFTKNDPLKITQNTIEMPNFDRTFSSLEEEAKYWKEKYLHLFHEYKTLNDTFIEFQESSGELENELEKQLIKLEEETNQIRKEKDELQQQYNELKKELQTKNEQSAKEIQTLLDALQEYRNSENMTKELIQKMEQENDDFEKDLRIAKSSVMKLTEDLEKEQESMLLLKNDKLEDEKKYNEMIQRFKDEIEEYKQEIQVLQGKHFVSTDDVQTSTRDLISCKEQFIQCNLFNKNETKERIESKERIQNETRIKERKQQQIQTEFETISLYQPNKLNYPSIQINNIILLSEKLKEGIVKCQNLMK